MSTTNCPNCNTSNSPNSRYCSNCATLLQPPQETPKQQTTETPVRDALLDIWRSLSAKAKVWIIGIAAIVLMYVIGSINRPHRTTIADLATPSSQPGSSQPPTASKPPEPVQQPQPALYLANAKKDLADGYRPTGKDKAWGKVKDARASLQLIRPSDKEYAEAQKLMREVERREAEIEKWSRAVARQLVAEQMERNYLEKGMDVEVRVSGEGNRTIKFKYVLISRPLVYQLTNDAEFIRTLRNAGFNKIVFTDGYRSTWTQDLD